MSIYELITVKSLTCLAWGFIGVAVVIAVCLMW